MYRLGQSSHKHSGEWIVKRAERLKTYCLQWRSPGRIVRVRSYFVQRTRIIVLRFERTEKRKNRTLPLHSYRIDRGRSQNDFTRVQIKRSFLSRAFNVSNSVGKRNSRASFFYVFEYAPASSFRTYSPVILAQWNPEKLANPNTADTKKS